MLQLAFGGFVLRAGFITLFGESAGIGEFAFPDKRFFLREFPKNCRKPFPLGGAMRLNSAVESASPLHHSESSWCFSACCFMLGFMLSTRTVNTLPREFNWQGDFNFTR
jgi:hypothetical protein